MRNQLVTAALLGAVLAWFGLPVQAAPKPTTDKAVKIDVEKAEKSVKEHLDGLKGSQGRVTAIKDPAVGSALPRHVFFFVLFPQYPVARISPAGLKSANVFASDAQGKVSVFTDAKELEKFFKANLAPAKSDDKLKEAIRAWLALAQQFRQDGYYTFVLQDKSIEVKQDKQGKSVVGEVIVMKGGNGNITGRLDFDSAGKLTSGVEAGKLRPGVRPRCHATKLLDPDPVVRAIVEQDLMIMGRAAKPYLDEQRGKANRELQRAIDRIWERIRDQDE